MKKENWLLATLAGAGIGAIVYSLLARDFPAGAVPVKPFDMNRYLGKWYEIARLPNSVEKNLKNLTEEYSAIGDGKFKVVTKAYNFKKNKWRRATGTIKFGGGRRMWVC
ncbi:lipocalin family protein [Mucilaginibacter sp. L3T2-6]|uniref:lipocalin family protein n=1 Tax=Mucilaginibacter sp. L3T2-6 TaxID=3062491 RepID=UPI002675FD2E|nr:lipocalin family protein [Mucilaginibacter sp. L3T2-6]MDO3644395.1 lipocalin family protein [Mucilaginibacter sp. L3T2-6]MDV6216847.1 lipocalin family protein [Mucilaginibacter sp. L3T2-6]